LASLLAVAIEVHRAASERDLTQDRLRDSELRYRTFFNQSPEAIWRIELEEPVSLDLPEDEIIEHVYEHGYLAEANQAYASLHGFEDPLELAGARLDFLLPRSDPAHVEVLRHFIRSGLRINNVETVQMGRDGQEHIYTDSMLGMVERGMAVRAWGTRHEITEQRRAAAELAASEERFRALFGAAPVPIAIARNGITLYANAAALRLFGCDSPDQFIGHLSTEFVAPEDRLPYMQRIQRRSEGHQEPLTYELTGLRRDGSRFPVRVEVAILPLPDGLASLAFGFDLTGQKRIEGERQASLERERMAARRTHRLQEVTAALAGALTTEAVADVVVEQAVAALEGSSGALTVPEGGESGGLTVLRSVGYAHQSTGETRRTRLDSRLPESTAFREKRAVWLDAPESLFAEYPALLPILPRASAQALAAIPLLVEDRVLGIFSVVYRRPHHFDEDERAFMLTMAAQCAQALERVRLLTEAAQAARRQQESLALLDAVLDSAPVGFAMLDQESRLVLLNESLACILGLPPGSHVGRRLLECRPDLDQRVGEMLLKVLRTGEASGALDVILPPLFGSEEPRHAQISFYPILVNGDRLLGAGALMIDITERVRAEGERARLVVALETERARFEAILRQMPSAVIIAEAPGARLVLGNEQVNHVLRRPAGEQSESAWDGERFGVRADGLPLGPGDWPLERALYRGETVSGEEIIVLRGDGTTGTIRINAAPIRDRDGQVTAAVAIFDDITERARNDAAQRFLAEAGSELVTALDSHDAFETLAQLCVPRVADWCVICTLGEDGSVRPAAVASMGEAAQMAQLRFQLANEPQLPWNIAGAVRDRKPIIYEVRQGGAAHWEPSSPAFEELLEAMEARSAIIVPLEARGRVAGVMLWLTAQSGRAYDALDLALAEELGLRAALTADNARLYREAQAAGEEAQKALRAARLARDEAQNANRAKDEFLAVVSHELRTPLTPILGWTELLRSGTLDAKTCAAAYDAIERNAKAQAQIVNDILDVSRITTGKLRLDLRPVPLARELEKALEVLRPQADRKGLAIHGEFGDVGDIVADAGRLQQVLWNLLQNAIKFTPEGGRIEVSLRPEGEFAVLRVSDTGCGIPSEFLPHVFEQFRQADSSATRRAGGLGLGLAIVRHIVLSHGGTVAAASSGPNRGAVFTVHIPLGAPSAVMPGAPVERWTRSVAARNALDGLRVLLVEDDYDSRELIARILENAGAYVRASDSGESALKGLEVWLPHVVVSDIGMAGMDGYELRRRLRLRVPGIPVLALTAFASATDRRHVAEAGFEAYLAKPVVAEELVATVSQLMAPVNQPRLEEGSQPRLTRPRSGQQQTGGRTAAVTDPEGPDTAPRVPGGDGEA